MTEQEFEQLRRRFGANVSLWPAPYRQEALHFLARTEGLDDDAAQDRLILQATRAETDEVALARKVLARINDNGRHGLLAGLSQSWSMPVASSAFAALLLLAAVGGYIAASNATDGLDDALLAFALGDGGVGDDVFDSLAGEEQL
ncbi:MAG: hypothetical protein KF810_07885 [Rhizobiaceae bacterium]|nr:hypothetical protein [Rhizobiaceae bacterium]